MAPFGDYSVCRSDFTVAQTYDYDEADQAVWRLLCDRQTKLTERLAHRSYLDGVAALGLIDRIPDFAEVSDKLGKLDEARMEFERAASMTRHRTEQLLLARRAAECVQRAAGRAH